MRIFAAAGGERRCELVGGTISEGGQDDARGDRTVVVISQFDNELLEIVSRSLVAKEDLAGRVDGGGIGQFKAATVDIDRAGEAGVGAAKNQEARAGLGQSCA